MSETINWNGIVNMPTTGAPGGIVTLTLAGAASPFGERSSKPKNLKTVKLTEANAHELGKYIADKAGASIVEVDIAHGILALDFQEWESLAFNFGEWIVEEYDYYEERVAFRVADIDEREKYDLR